MDSESFDPSKESKCCSCSCCNLLLAETTWARTVKRKFELISDDRDRLLGSNQSTQLVVRVEAEDERTALREALRSQQQTIQELHTELEEERNASSSAANETMSMILRLQREKAETMMEARQFKRFAEEKMSHDQQEFLELEDLLYKREQIIQSLNCEIRAYKHRLLSLGYGEAEANAVSGSAHGRTRGGVENIESEFGYPSYDYPPLRCNLNEPTVSQDVNEAQFDLAFGDAPRFQEHLQDLEYQIHQLERNPSNKHMDGEFPGTNNFLDKTIVGLSPRGRLSHDSSCSFLGMVKDTSPSQDFRIETPRHGSGLNKVDNSGNMDDHPKKVDNASDFGDDMSDRIYTIDSVQGVPYNENCINGYNKPNVGTCEDYVTTPRESLADTGVPDIKKLYMRLQALEADRESLRQAIISMRTDKAQLILLKEIAQLLSKEMVSDQRTCMKKPSLIPRFSLISAFKWVVSIIFWRKKARKIKYMCELSNSVGLLLLLDKSSCGKQWRRSYKIVTSVSPTAYAPTTAITPQSPERSLNPTINRLCKSSK